MSSYELLELLEFMDDDGAFKTAARGGAWSEYRAATFAIANETAVLRAAMAPGAEGDKWGERLFIPPAILKEAAARAEEAQTARDSLMAMADISRQPGYEWMADAANS